MILLGYDSSVFNSVQVSENWKSAMGYPDPYMVGLINTVYTVGGIITGWFVSGPTVSFRVNLATHGAMVTGGATRRKETRLIY